MLDWIFNTLQGLLSLSRSLQIPRKYKYPVLYPVPWAAGVLCIWGLSEEDQWGRRWDGRSQNVGIVFHQQTLFMRYRFYLQINCQICLICLHHHHSRPCCPHPSREPWNCLQLSPTTTQPFHPLVCSPPNSQDSKTSREVFLETWFRSLHSHAQTPPVAPAGLGITSQPLSPAAGHLTLPAPPCSLGCRHPGSLLLPADPSPLLPQGPCPCCALCYRPPSSHPGPCSSFRSLLKCHTV